MHILPLLWIETPASLLDGYINSNHWDFECHFFCTQLISLFCSSLKKVMSLLLTSCGFCSGMKCAPLMLSTRVRLGTACFKPGPLIWSRYPGKWRTASSSAMIRYTFVITGQCVHGAVSFQLLWTSNNKGLDHSLRSYPSCGYLNHTLSKSAKCNLIDSILYVVCYGYGL